MMNEIVKFIAKRSLSGWVPVSKAAVDAFDKTKAGELVELTVKKPRNLKFHAKYWAMCSLVANNHDTLDTPELIHLFLKAATGLGEWITVPGATKPLFKESSISFAKMSQDEFDAYYDNAVKAVCKWLLPQTTSAELERELVNF